ncbi:MAG: SurA N-terminal domain-containing protein [Holosporales bacterium]
MLETIRQNASTWWFRAILLAMALAFAFLWGISDVITRVSGGSGNIATVGSQRIALQDFLKAVNRDLLQLQARTGQVIDAEQAKKMGLYGLVLERMVNESLMIQDAQRLKIRVTDDSVRRMVTEDKTFQNAEGAFDKQRFDAILSRLNYSEATFVDMLQKDMVQQRLTSGLTAGVVVPAMMTMPLYAWQHEKRSVVAAIYEISAQKLSVMPTDDEIKAFFEQNQKNYEAPEFRTISALVIDSSAYLHKVSVTEEDLQQAYETRKDEFEGKPFKAVKEQLLTELRKNKALEFTLEQNSKIEDDLAAGTTLAEAANKYGLKILKLTGVNQEGRTDPYAKGPKSTEPSPLERAIAKEGFNLEAGSQGPVVEAEPGLFFIAMVDDVMAATPRPFDVVKEDVKKQLTQQRQREQALASIKDMVAEGNKKPGQFATLFTQKGLQLNRLKISRTGTIAPSTMKISQEMVDRLYTLPLGTASYTLSPDGKQIIIAAVERVEPTAMQNKGKELSQFAENIRHLMAEDIVVQYVNYLRRNTQVEVNRGLLQKL